MSHQMCRQGPGLTMLNSISSKKLARRSTAHLHIIRKLLESSICAAALPHEYGHHFPVWQLHACWPWGSPGSCTALAVSGVAGECTMISLYYTGQCVGVDAFGYSNALLSSDQQRLALMQLQAPARACYRLGFLHAAASPYRVGYAIR